MVLLLLAWCAGLVAGNTQLVPGLVLPLLAVGAAAGAVAAGILAAGPSRAAAWQFVPCLLLLAAARGASAVHLPGPTTIDGWLGRHVTLVGTVERAGGGGGLQSFRLARNTLGGRQLEGTVQVNARSAVTVVPGSVVRVTGTLERLPGRAYDGSTGYDDRMERQGVLGALPAASYTILASPPPWAVNAMTWRARLALSDGVRARVPEPEASMLLGFLVGIRGKLPPAIEAQLVNSGLVHLLAVSGLKVALVASMLATLLRRAGRRAALFAAAGIFIYALVGGGSSAALRSALMGSLSLVAQVLRRDPDPPRSLLLAAAPMLSLNPALAADLSFQYSFLGVAGIQLMVPPLARRLRRLPHLLREGLAVTLAAQVATLPLTAGYFHVVSLSAPLANAVAIPMLGPTMAVSAWLALGLPDPGGVIAAAGSGLAHLFLATAAVAAGWPGLVLQVPWFGSAHVVAYLAGLAVVLAAALMGRPRATLPRLLQPALATTAAGMVVAAAVLLLLTRPDGHLQLVFLDTPGGGAMIRAPDGARLLVDTGTSPTRLGAALDAQLAPAGPGLDTLLLTGSAPAAAGGVDGLGRRRPAAYLAPALTDGNVPRRLAGLLAAAGARVETVGAGDRLRWHGIDLEVEPCGAGLAVTVSFGETVAWICDAGNVGDPGTLPPGALAVVDAGPGTANPGGAWAGAGWVVAHGTRSPSGVLPAAVLGPRLWRPARDGPLTLSCDRRSCRRT